MARRVEKIGGRRNSSPEAVRQDPGARALPRDGSERRDPLDRVPTWERRDGENRLKGARKNIQALQLAMSRGSTPGIWIAATKMQVKQRASAPKTLQSQTRGGSFKSEGNLGCEIEVPSNRRGKGKEWQLNTIFVSAGVSYSYLYKGIIIIIVLYTIFECVSLIVFSIIDKYHSLWIIHCISDR